MGKAEIIARIVECGVIPVIRASSASEARTIIDSIAEGGIPTIEVTMTVPGAVQLISELAAQREDLLIGAGSVRNPETARECADAGAQFIVTPATNFEIIKYCSDQKIVVMPGALTPTEIVTAWGAGADIVKVFPVDAMGGPNYIRALKAPLPDIKLVPTGGVTRSTAAEFIKAGAEAVGVGSDLVDLKAVREDRSGDITKAAKDYISIVANARMQNIKSQT